MQKIYTGLVELSNNTYTNHQTITQVDLMKTPWVNNSMDNAFYNCTNLNTVSNVHKNVTNMYQAFYNCQQLTSISAFPTNLTELAAGFAYCINLVNIPTIPNSVRNLNDTFHDCYCLNNVPDLTDLNCSSLVQTFKCCNNLTKQPNLPTKATSLHHTFFGCSNLTAINIPQNVYSLGETYYGCSNLTTIPNISTNVNWLYHTFGACVNITGDINILSDKIVNVTNLFGETSARKNVYIPPVCYNDTSINSPTYNAFIAAGYDNIGTKDGVYLMYNYAPALPSDWITSTAANNTIVLEQYIGANTTVITPHNDWYSNKVLNASKNDYYGPLLNNKNIISIDFSNVELINNNFARGCFGCNNLTTVTNLNQNITNMYYAFRDCPNLITVPALPPNLINMQSIFSGAYKLQFTSTIPNTVTDMQGAFHDCRNVTILPAIPNSVIDFSGAFWNTGLTEATLNSNSIRTLCLAFADCDKLTSANITATNCQNVSSVFGWCSNLTDVNISVPNCIDIVDHFSNTINIFYGCTNLTNVYAEFNSASNVINLFQDCTSLETVNISAQNVINAAGLFINCQKLTNVEWNIPSCLNLYRTFDYCSNLITAPDIPNSVTTMIYTFRDCINITDAPVIPNSVINMDFAFQGCTNLINIPTIPDSVTTLHSTFFACTNLVNAPTISNSAIDMSYAFMSCPNLIAAPAIPGSVTNLAFTFDYDYNLVSAPAIPSAVTNMVSTFERCFNLTGNVYINSQGITNAKNCFYATSLIKNVYIPFEYENDVATQTYTSFNAAYPVNTMYGTITGTLTNNAGVVNGFSTVNYITGNIAETFQSESIENFEIQIKITTPSSFTSNGRVLNWNGGADSTTGPYIEIPNGSAIDLLFYDGVTYTGYRAKAGISINTVYWFKWIYDGTNIISYYKVNDDGEWILNETKTVNQSVIRFMQTDFTLGGRAFDASPVCVWNGAIDLNNCYIKINDKKVWFGYGRPNGVILKDIDGAKVTIVPDPVDATVLMFSRDKGKKVDEETLNKFSYVSVNGDVEIEALNTSDSSIVVPSIWTETDNLRAVAGAVLDYIVFKDGYETAMGQIIVDEDIRTIPVTLTEITPAPQPEENCTFTIIPIQIDATVTLTATEELQVYGWTYRGSTIYTASSTPNAGDPIYEINGSESSYSPVYYYDSTNDYIVDSQTDCSWSRDTTADTTIGPVQSGNSITVPKGTEVNWTVARAGCISQSGTVVVNNNYNKVVCLEAIQYTFTINPTPDDADIEIFVNGKLANASNSDWIFTAYDANNNIELQEYIGSNTAVTIPTTYEVTNSVQVIYSDIITYYVKKAGYKTVTDTISIHDNTILSVVLKTNKVNVAEYEYDLENATVTLTKYIGEGGDIDTPELEEV